MYLKQLSPPCLLQTGLQVYVIQQLTVRIFQDVLILVFEGK